MTEQFEVPMPALVAAYRLAQRRTDDDTASRIRGLLCASAEAASEASSAPHVAELWRWARQGIGEALLPFSVDSVTAAAAVISAAKAPAKPFRLFSEDSIIDLGYVEVSRQGLRYVDRISNEVDGTRPEDFPSLAVPMTWLDRLQAVDDKAPTASFSEESGDRLHINLDAESAPAWGGRAKRINLVLIRKADGGPVQRRSLGSLSVGHLEGGCLELRLTGEQQLEVHAAHFAGALISIDDQHREALFPVPSLDAGAPAVNGRTTLPHLGCGDIPFVQVCVPVSHELALHLGRLHWWFNPVKNLPAFALSVDLLAPATEPVIKPS